MQEQLRQRVGVSAAKYVEGLEEESKDIYMELATPAGDIRIEMTPNETFAFETPIEIFEMSIERACDEIDEIQKKIEAMLIFGFQEPRFDTPIDSSVIILVTISHKSNRAASFSFEIDTEGNGLYTLIDMFISHFRWQIRPYSVKHTPAVPAFQRPNKGRRICHNVPRPASSA